MQSQPHVTCRRNFLLQDFLIVIRDEIRMIGTRRASAKQHLRRSDTRCCNHRCRVQMDPNRIERQQPREYGRLLRPKHSPRKRLKEVMVKIDKSWSDNAPAKADPLLAFGDRSIGGSEI